MLEAAGVEHDVVPARIDEDAVKARLSNGSEIAAELAKAKALDVSTDRTKDWVIGSDSVVTVAGRLFDKPVDRAHAAEHLRFFSGRSIQLTSAVALARAGKIEWSCCDSAMLQVRELSEEFIGSYLDAEWPEVSYCVGVFRIEGRGVQLFEKIEGDHFAILGMPLFPLLGALRERGVIAR